MEEKTTKTPKENLDKKENTKNTSGKVLTGVVVSTKMKDTIVVRVERFVKHPKIGKYIKLAKKVKAHDAGNTVKEGDKVTIKETKPISKDKRFILVNEQ